MSLTLRHAPRISREKFAAVLTAGTQAGVSPVAPIANDCYAVMVASGLDPAIILAIWAKETQYGVTGISPQTHNIGNVRTAYHPDWAIGQHPKGFAIYPDWFTGIRDLVDRLDKRYIDDWGLTTVEQIITKYAPPSENDTAGYITFVYSHVEKWQQEDTGAMTTTGYADRTALIPISTEDKPDQRSGDKLTSFAAMVIHETANESPTATAEMHRRYWMPGGGGALISSVQFVTDATESIQLIPIDEQASHAGDVTGNTTGVGIEICVNSRAGYAEACRKAALIVAKVLRAEGKTPIDGTTIRKHGSYPGTTHTQCPLHLNRGDWGVTWGGFIALVNAAYGAAVGPDYKAIWSAKHPEIAYNPTFGFPTKWRAELDAGRSLGAVLSPELGDTIVWQVFESGVLKLVKATNTITVLR